MKTVASVARETGTLKAAERICTVGKYITGPIFTLVLVCAMIRGSCYRVVEKGIVKSYETVARYARARLTLNKRLRREHTR